MLPSAGLSPHMHPCRQCTERLYILLVVSSCWFIILVYVFIVGCFVCSNWDAFELGRVVCSGGQC